MRRNTYYASLNDEETSTGSSGDGFMRSSSVSTAMTDATFQQYHQQQQQPKPLASKNNRVRVVIRCRKYHDQNDDNNTMQIVNGNDMRLHKLTLHILDRNLKREFHFDNVFDTETSQKQTYDIAAASVIDSVLNGYNGSIIAYGQTGTGKTHTMGILNRVHNISDEDGIIPKSLHNVFDKLSNDSNVEEFEINMSFVQIYLDTLNDLLVPVDAEQNIYEDNLIIREDPVTGFYIEGLREYKINSYFEAISLLNIGLENRNISCTTMNTTSSRSHTILSITISQRVNSDGLVKKMKSKLLLVDLAGSERVRRTKSKNKRLDEAKSINTSLSALGNVIASLADHRMSHIPYRDSKLTRILQNSLSGKSNTVLIATISKLPINNGETLSTLMFASRCMHVKSNPVINEAVDYASLCTQLQLKLANIKTEYNQREMLIRDDYERQIYHLKQNQSNNDEQSNMNFPSTKNNLTDFSSNQFIVNQCYKTLIDSNQLLHNIIYDNYMQLKTYQDEMIAKDQKLIDSQTHEIHLMGSNDALNKELNLNTKLRSINKLEARYRIDEKYPLLNSFKMDKLKSFDSIDITSNLPQSSESIQAHLKSLYQNFNYKVNLIHKLYNKRETQIKEIKEDVIDQLLEKRNREEELINWSYILNYLLSANSKLRKEIKTLKQSSNTASKTSSVPPPIHHSHFTQSNLNEIPAAYEVKPKLKLFERKESSSSTPTHSSGSYRNKAPHDYRTYESKESYVYNSGASTPVNHLSDYHTATAFSPNQQQFKSYETRPAMPSSGYSQLDAFLTGHS